MTTLLERIQEAGHKLATYRNPNIEDVHTELSNIADAAGLSGIIGQITGIYVYDDVVTVNYDYSIRGYHDSDSVSIPMSIIKADGPIKAAKLYHITKQISRYEIMRNSAARTISDCDQKILDLMRTKMGLS